LKISVIIPSFNQAPFLEECLLSILTQDHPDKEIIVVDGGSSDGSVGILKNFADRLVWWVSEPDRGQTDAINKGLRRMSGTVWMYLNSDDTLAAGALSHVAAAFASDRVRWLSGIGEVWRDGRIVSQLVPGPAQSGADYLRPWARRGRFVFPFSGACFLHREVYARCGGLDETFHYSMDMEYYTRLALRGGIEQTFSPRVLARWRWHDASKTNTVGSSYGFLEEEVRIAERYLPDLPAAEQAIVRRDLHEQRCWLAVRRASHRREGDSARTELARLFGELRRQPRLLGFRPWLGAVRRATFSRSRA
jgi:glycosyltransferase involved in cell wall biosynthesis